MEPVRPLSPLLRWIPVLRQPVAQAMAWMAASGFVFSLLNTWLRAITLEMGPLETQFLRYLCGLAVMLPFIMRVGLRAYSPNGIVGQLWRGTVHMSGLMLWCSFDRGLARIVLSPHRPACCCSLRG